MSNRGGIYEDEEQALVPQSPPVYAAAKSPGARDSVSLHYMQGRPQAGSFSSQTSGINGDVQDGRRGSDVLSPGGRKGVRPPGVHRTCPQCSGRGRVAGDAVELVSLVPYSDPRLKPRYTKTLIAVSAVLTLMAAASLCFVLWPRPVTFEAEFNYYVEGLSGMYGDENCPALTSACESRVAKYSANQSAVCDTLAGCVFTRDNICAGCSTLTDKNKGSALCQANHQCVFIKPDNDGNPVSTCESSQMGPVEFKFNYTMQVVNNNYLPATLKAGMARLSFTDSSPSGSEIEVDVAAHVIQSPKPIAPRRNVTIRILMNANVSLWNFENQSTPKIKTNYTDKDELQRKIIHDICEKCGAFSAGVPERNQFFANMNVNLTAVSAQTSFDLSHSGIISLTCLRTPYIPGSTFHPHNRTTTTKPHNHPPPPPPPGPLLSIGSMYIYGTDGDRPTGAVAEDAGARKPGTVVIEEQSTTVQPEFEPAVDALYWANMLGMGGAGGEGSDGNGDGNGNSKDGSEIGHPTN